MNSRNVFHCGSFHFDWKFLEICEKLTLMNLSPPQHSTQQNEAALHAVDYWQVIRNRYGIILLTLLLVFMTAAVITYVMPKKYESEATIEVKPRVAGMSPLGQRHDRCLGCQPDDAPVLRDGVREDQKPQFA